MSVQQAVFRGFANPVDPTPGELRSWAYHPEAVPIEGMPADWDLLVAGDRLIGTLFALHCLYIYAADGIRTGFRAHPKRRLRKFVELAESEGDDFLGTWAHNTRMLLARPDLFDYHDWCEGGLVRSPRRLT